MLVGVVVRDTTYPLAGLTRITGVPCFDRLCTVVTRGLEHGTHRVSSKISVLSRPVL